MTDHEILLARIDNLTNQTKLLSQACRTLYKLTQHHKPEDELLASLAQDDLDAHATQ